MPTNQNTAQSPELVTQIVESIQKKRALKPGNKLVKLDLREYQGALLKKQLADRKIAPELRKHEKNRHAIRVRLALAKDGPVIESRTDKSGKRLYFTAGNGQILNADRVLGRRHPLSEARIQSGRRLKKNQLRENPSGNPVLRKLVRDGIEKINLAAAGGAS